MILLNLLIRCCDIYKFEFGEVIEMIILTSNGLSSEHLLREVHRYIKRGKAALVITADNEYKEKNYHVERLTKELEALGLSVECFDYDTQHPHELLTYDVVEMIGGNPYYLLNSIKIHGFDDVLKTFAEDRILIGCSAGSLVITPNLNLVNAYSPEMNTVGLSGLSALCLTDVQILPHYNKFLKRYNAFEEKCIQYEKDNNCNVVRINDGESVIINKDNLYVIRV